MNTELDVRTIEPRFKHPFIFENFDKLLHGEILTIINDHDPLPLYYQLKAERSGIFEWNYEEKGPAIWKINITKKLVSDETVADIARQFPHAVPVFKKLHIDFCCNGNRLFTEVCKEAGLIPEEIKLQIVQSTEKPPIHFRADDWSASFLVDYILQNHHTYVKRTIPQLEALLAKVESVHGNEHPEIHAIHTCFVSLAEELLGHMQKEEQMLFPIIKQLVKHKDSGEAIGSFPFQTIRNPIAVMENEHAGAGEDMENIRRLTNNFNPPADACQSYRLLYKLLEEFEDDLHQHVHLENNLLFPKAIELEKGIQ
jgi:regulator of cell morphogenesis and NO signaling